MSGRLERFQLDGSVELRGGQMFVSGRGVHSAAARQVLVPHPHGVVSWPVAGGQGIVGYLGGNCEQPVLIGHAAPGGVPALNPGGTVLYDAHGAAISIVDRQIRHVAATHTFVGDVAVDGKLSVTGDVANGGNMTTGGVHTDAIGPHNV